MRTLNLRGPYKIGKCDICERDEVTVARFESLRSVCMTCIDDEAKWNILFERIDEIWEEIMDKEDEQES